MLGCPAGVTSNWKFAGDDSVFRVSVTHEPPGDPSFTCSRCTSEWADDALSEKIIAVSPRFVVVNFSPDMLPWNVN